MMVPYIRYLKLKWKKMFVHEKLTKHMPNFSSKVSGFFLYSWYQTHQVKSLKQFLMDHAPIGRLFFQYLEFFRLRFPHNVWTNSQYRLIIFHSRVWSRSQNHFSSCSFLILKDKTPRNLVFGCHFLSSLLIDLIDDKTFSLQSVFYDQSMWG